MVVFVFLSLGRSSALCKHTLVRIDGAPRNKVQERRTNDTTDNDVSVTTSPRILLIGFRFTSMLITIKVEWREAAVRRATKNHRLVFLCLRDCFD